MASKRQQKALQALAEAAKSPQEAQSGNLVVGDETGFGPAGKYVWIEKADCVVDFVFSSGEFEVKTDIQVSTFTKAAHVSLHEQKLVKKGAKCILITGFYDREDGRRIWESALYFKKPKAKHVLPRRA